MTTDNNLKKDKEKEIRAPSTMSIIAVLLIITYCYINVTQIAIASPIDMTSPVMLILGYYFGSSVKK